MEVANRKKESSNKKFEQSNKELKEQEVVLAKFKEAVDTITPILNTGLSKEEDAIKAEQVSIEEVESPEKRLVEARSTLASTREGLTRIKSYNANLSHFDTCS
ncbi:hypothetical protein PIB30_015068 [Stylosanthes scabra]|uniref:Uncharacterized protein n=1 Tax=Stylosanthes scabra TaxID=79078 RepID=A0ABU6Q7H7_9FABA|nr:hypothetical protein [Stylosanthes scabra]